MSGLLSGQGGGGEGGGTITNFVLADVDSHSNLAAGPHDNVEPTGWSTNTRHYLGGDASAGSTITGFEELPVGTIRTIELGDRNSKGPLYIYPYDSTEAASSLGANRIVTPDNQILRVDPGGMFAMIYIGGGPLHGWRVMWATSTVHQRIGLKHIRFHEWLSGTLAAGTTHDWAPTGYLSNSRWRITTDSTGSTLTGILKNSASTPGYGDGELRFLENVGPGTLTLPHVGAGSLGYNSFWNPGGMRLVLPVNGTAIYIHDAILDAWRLLACTPLASWSLGPALVPAALPAGDTNDYEPTGYAGYTTIRVTPHASGSTLTGLKAGKEGEIKVLEVVYSSGGSLTLAEYRTSAGVNCFVLPGLTDLIIRPAGAVILRYDATLEIWRPIGVSA